MYLFERKPSIFKRHRALFIWGILIVLIALFVLVVVFAILPFILVAGYAGIQMSESPAFCGNVCHNMKPFYESYENSAHKGIRCGECHNEPGFIGSAKAHIVGAINESVLYFSGNYGKEPLVCDISNRSCLREECHKIERLQEKVFLYEGIPFSHKIHSGEFAHNIILKCVSCHATDSIVHMSLDFSTCYLCHTNGVVTAEEPQKCLACHEGTLEDIATYDHSGILKSGIACSKCHTREHEPTSVAQERCDLCHHVQEEKKEEFSPEKLHKIHTFDHAVECILCHNEIIHEYEAAFSGNCLDCHQKIKTLNTLSFGNRTFPHLRHTTAAKCTYCHSSKKETHGTLLIGSASCSSCHHSQERIACSRCHGIPNAIQNGISLSGIKGVEGYKSGVIDCESCHENVKEGTSLAKLKDACANCHEDAYKALVDEWQASTQKAIAEVDALINKAKPGKTQEAKQLIKEAQTLLYYARADGSKGVHNPDYIEEILKLAKKKAHEALR
jgi:hypothetical protein